MRAWLPVVLTVPLALAGCPAMLSDWTINGVAVDASVDATGPEAAAGRSGSGSGGSGGSSGANGGSSPGGSSSGGALSSSGGLNGSGGAGGSSGSDGAVDACTLVTHSTGTGQTWQDCVPLYTYDKDQAMKACKESGATNCALSGACGYMLCGYKLDAPGGTCTGCWGYDGPFVGLISPAAPPGSGQSCSGGVCPTQGSAAGWD